LRVAESFLRLFLASLLALSASACGDDSGSPPPNDPEPPPDMEIGCERDPRVLTFSSTVTVVPANFEITLESTQPSPPAKGANHWRVRVEDSNGSPLAVDSVEAEPFMPDHNHGPPRAPVVTRSGDVWDIDAIDFFMPGVWRMTITVKAGTREGAGEFFYCVAG
jgi:hypothetical protein